MSNADGDAKTCQAAAYRAARIHGWLQDVLRSSKAAESAYAFKGRVKTSEDIINKVLGRRNHENASQRRPDFDADDVTDASGFRIVRLFNSEVPEASADDRTDGHRERAAEILNKLRGEVDGAAWSTGSLDTMIRAEATFGDPAKAKELAGIVGARLNERIAAFRRERNCTHIVAFNALSRDEQDIYLNAQDVLS